MPVGLCCTGHSGRQENSLPQMFRRHTRRCEQCGKSQIPNPSRQSNAVKKPRKRKRSAPPPPLIDHEDDFYESPAPALPGKRLPPRRRKKQKQANQDVRRESSGGWFSSYEGQRIKSVLMGFAMIFGGCIWLYFGFTEAKKIYIYPFFLLGSGFLMVMRAALAD